jgi:hypothetical protein
LRFTILILFSVLFLFSCKDSVDKDAPEGHILTFTMDGFSSVSGTIDTDTKTITLTLPYQTNLKGLVPQIAISEGCEIIPASGIEQDFSGKVYYTLISSNGAKAIYTVQISTEAQPRPQIKRISRDSVEAGFEFEVNGKYFGSFPLDVKVSLEKEGAAVSAAFTYKNDSTLLVKTAEKTLPGDYQVTVNVKQLSVSSAKKIRITQAAPKIRSVNAVNFFPPDTLKLVGEHLSTGHYHYALRFINGSDSLTTRQVIIVKDTLKYGVPKNFSPGKYRLKIVNLTDGKISRETAPAVQIYSGNMPYAVLKENKTYAIGQDVIFTTLNFTAQQYRFYQVTLTGAGKSFVQNGIFDTASNTLRIAVPESAPSGNYTIGFSLSDPAKGLRYDFKTDDQLMVK